VAQFGSASGWGPEGRRFKSCQPDNRLISESKNNAQNERGSREVPKNNSDGRNSQGCAVVAGSNFEGPMVDRVKLSGISPGISGRISLGPVTALAGKAK
jgi:hypothetical protein